MWISVCVMSKGTNDVQGEVGSETEERGFETLPPNNADGC